MLSVECPAQSKSSLYLSICFCLVKLPVRIQERLVPVYFSMLSVELPVRIQEQLVPVYVSMILVKWLVQVQEQLVPVYLFLFGQVASSIQEQLVPVYFVLSPGGVTSSHPRTSSHLSICLCFQSSDQFESRTTRTCLPFLCPQL
uniref:Uncharacterized protein n=1 Tax=Medicago truncatula TaxID=3880 RepID=Q1S5K0_MEDTR|nr:hypothetical protein MtrDRAFT_AC147431g50v2 [Medicago truncatula]